MGNLSEPLNVRLEAEQRAELDRRAEADHRPASVLARLYIAEGLERARLAELESPALTDLIDAERIAGRAFGSLAEACRLELARRGIQS